MSASPVLSSLTVLSRACPFVTLAASDVTGPASRAREAVGISTLPRWLRAWEHHLTLGQTLVAVTMGRARLGSVIRVRRIIEFAASNGRPPFAHVYVEEREASSPAPRTGAPLHVVRCKQLPKRIRFIETPPPPPGEQT